MSELEASKSPTIAREKAYTALLDAITQGVEDIRSASGYSVADQSGVLLKLAHSFRLTVGGPQPGNVDSK